MSLQRVYGNCFHGLEEAARWLPLVGQGDMNLEMGLGTPQGEALDIKAIAMRLRQQYTGKRSGGRVAGVHDDLAPLRNLTRRPCGWQPPAHLAAGPTGGIERLELELGHSAQRAANDQDVAAAARATERPHPWHITGLKKNDQGDAGERGVTGANDHFDGRRTQPPHGRPFAKDGQAILHPAHQHAAPADIPGRSGGEPGHDHDRGDSDDFRHGGPEDSTPFVAKWSRILREVLYGMTTYEFVQQARELRAAMQRLFLVGVFGDMIGVPILPSYYGLRLLPFIVPQIEAWKREVLRERELGTDHEHHLHGL